MWWWGGVYDVSMPGDQSVAQGAISKDIAPVSLSRGLVPGLPVDRPLTIVDFLTDGSLAALCQELTRLSGVVVQLRDASGRLIERDLPTTPGHGAWRLNDEATSPPIEPGSIEIPLLLDEAPIGTIVMGPGHPALPDDARQVLQRALVLLTRTASELCEHELELRHRLKEVGAIYKVSSMLARAVGAERVLETALESVLDAMELDAGAIMLLKQDEDGSRHHPDAQEDENDLYMAASRNLSREWITWNQPLSRGRAFDRDALNGEVVVSEDLANDPRVLIPERVAQEGLGATIQCGLIFQERPIGVIRLYSRLPREFGEEDRRLLRSIAHQAAVAVEQARLLQFEREEQRIQRQLQLAANVQRRMLAHKPPDMRGVEIAVRYQPSFELGGDFYDFINLNGHMGVVIGDVVGKGIPAALLMSAVRASLRAHVQRTYDLDDVVSKVNVALCHDTMDNEFASLWYGVIDPATWRLTYCSAGHEPTFVVRAPAHRPPSKADIDELGVGGMVVGVDPSQRYQRAICDLRPRDFIIAYTDGVPDTLNFSGERFGKKRLHEAVLTALKNTPDATAAHVLERIVWEQRQFAGLNTRPDDATIIVIRIGDEAARRA